MKLKFTLLLVAIIAMASIHVAPSRGQDGPTVPAVLTMPEQIAGGRDVHITVSNKPPADLVDELALYESQVAKFQEMYPNVTVEGLELEYDPTAYLALVAGGQLPTLFKTYFTEPEKFIGQNAVADLTPLYTTTGLDKVFNPNVLAIASQDGKVYGIPDFAYSLGLAYNIQMLADAGYDAPPTTWDELAEMAVKLTNKDDGVAGFAFINDGSGATGWHYTNIAYGFGATPEDIIKPEGDGNYSAHFGEGATVDALNFIHDLRWEYDVLPGATLDWGTITEALASDRVAMVIYAGDQLGYMNNQFPDADLSNFGYAPMPAGPNGSVSLTGGNLWMVNGSASADEQEAAFYFQAWRQFDPTEYQNSIITLSEQGRAVGQPVLPLYVGDYQTAREAFEAQYNVLPVENYTAFNEAVKAGEVTLQAEPPAAAQDYYSELGVLVTEVLSDEHSDPAGRLAEVAEEFQAFVLDR
ncbi:MAG: extracellular solute-binding protein [Chloroflexi bacterium]|nr:extracellular solute-binding protein [Chloroflexota bacterium]